MEEIKTIFIDCSSWINRPQINTTGSRSKIILVDPINYEEHFFKSSKILDNNEIRYPFEFWSEIIASKVGQSLNIPVLDYNIAYLPNEIQTVGCISKSMINESQNVLVEGKQWIRQLDINLNVGRDKNRYTWQLLEDCLTHANLENFIINLINMVVFDAVISNSDRHQENWATIFHYSNISSVLTQKNSFFKDLFRKIFGLDNKILTRDLIYEFSPIYDNGCCLGRELNDNRINAYLKDPNQLMQYCKRGKSEIHWNDNKKRSHFDLVSLIAESHKKFVRETIEAIVHNYDYKTIERIINEVDSELPSALNKFKLEQNRKELMIKIINLRLKLLEEILEKI